MTLSEARCHSGSRVRYTPHHGGPSEEGVITQVRGIWVFVLYDGAGTNAKATRPDDLELIQDESE